MNNSTADYFIPLSNKLSLDYKVIVIAGKIRDKKSNLNEEVTVLQWPSKRPNSWRDFWFLWNLVRTYKPEMMISIFSFVNLFLIVGWIFRVKTRVAWIRTLSSQYQQKHYKVLRKSMIYRFATHIITNSEATKNDVHQFYKIPKAKITVLANSVNDHSQKYRNVKIDKENLLFVGRLHPSKGVDVLINAFSQVLRKFPERHLDIIGQGPILEDLVKLTEHLGISKHVTFIGEKSKDFVLEAYKKSYCTIVPSHSEAFGFTVIEAMSVGTCVIGANNTGIKEIIIHEETGLLFETGDSKALQRQIERVLVDESFRNKLALNGYQRFLDIYENSVAINRDVQFFNQLKYT